MGEKHRSWQICFLYTPLTFIHKKHLIGKEDTYYMCKIKIWIAPA